MFACKLIIQRAVGARVDLSHTEGGMRRPKGDKDCSHLPAFDLRLVQPPFIIRVSGGLRRGGHSELAEVCTPLGQTLQLEIISGKHFIFSRGWVRSAAQGAGRARRAAATPVCAAAPRARSGGAGAGPGARRGRGRQRLSRGSPRAPPGRRETAAARLG